ncbi:hypothetical protein CK203_056213 [Vitis vinifera]|uniref:Reverse transcriptase zinc-binding domain-containing protein n=1 Tax=Vitis vinifera TaxID=29760 RepID=A0A438GDH3_VITVI|nr:hypothetical protein CK203_056213 [Vitis vinifera]
MVRDWEGKRDHLVRWDVVCKPKAIGGLGFGNISLRNLALLGNGYGDGHIVVLGKLLHKSFKSFPCLLGFPSKFVWNSQVPFKVKSFVWLVAHKKQLILILERHTADERRDCLDDHCFKGGYGGAESGTQSLGRQGLDGAQEPRGHVFEARDPCGSVVSEVLLDTGCEVGEGGEVGSSGLLKGSGFSVEAQVTKQWRCNSAVGKGKELLPASVSVCSRVAFTDESLVAEANRFSGSSSLSPLGSLDSECRLLKMLLQDGNLLEFSGSAANGTSGKELVVMTEELEPGCNSVGEDLVSLPGKGKEHWGVTTHFVRMPSRFKFLVKEMGCSWVQGELCCASGGVSLFLGSLESLIGSVQISGGVVDVRGVGGCLRVYLVAFLYTMCVL